uniref:Uncharacterized protein n=1 Tax=Timema douglasi TaxID=61478 RepID=A0A7R8VC26_TIMDO|nr:unnamed protein product [Timema douglasi]
MDIQYIFLKLNVNTLVAILQFMKKDTKNLCKELCASQCQRRERLNALAVLSMEKNFLNCHPEIKKKIIELFAQIKTRRMDFIIIKEIFMLNQH